MGLQWEDYIHWDMEWLKLCDAILFLGPSRGANLELKSAKEMGKLIFRSLDEIPVANDQNAKTDLAN
jgi:hypothetical protein